MNSTFLKKKKLGIREKNVCLFLLKIKTFYQMMKKKRLVAYLTYFVAYIHVLHNLDIYAKKVCAVSKIRQV